jgi:drug/metabolite transporter (DMT)-like permease
LFLDPVAAWQNWSQRSFLSVVYLAVFGSVIGYASYTYALSKLPSTRVSVITYINVVVALLLGWLVLDEEITLRIVMAAVLIIGGVIVANLRRREVIKAEKEPLPEVIE